MSILTLHCVISDSQTTHVIVLTDSMSLLEKSGMGSPDWHVSMFSTSIFEESCGCTVLDMLESTEMTEQIDWREKKQPSQAGCVSEDLKC